MTQLKEAMNAIEYFESEDYASQYEDEFIDDMLEEHDIEPLVETCNLYDYTPYRTLKGWNHE